MLEFFSPQILRQINSSNFRIAKTSHVAKSRVFETLELLNLNSHKMWSEPKYLKFHFSVHSRCKKMSVWMIHVRFHWRQRELHSCSIHWQRKIIFIFHQHVGCSYKTWCSSPYHILHQVIFYICGWTITSILTTSPAGLKQFQNQTIIGLWIHPLLINCCHEQCFWYVVKYELVYNWIVKR